MKSREPLHLPSLARQEQDNESDNIDNEINEYKIDASDENIFKSIDVSLNEKE